MKSSDPASLQNLNEIVLPATVDWWPLASGWYLLFGLVLLALTWFGYRFLYRWKNNRYRRAALHELQILENGIEEAGERDANLRKIPVLLKRTALSVYPREQVASLSGESWFQFLNSTVKTPPFTNATAGTLNTVSYSTGALINVDSKAAKALLDATQSWLKNHQPIAHPRGDRNT
jgi:hypothetical protein